VKLKLAVIISHHRWFVLTASGDTLRDTPSLASAWGFAEFLPSGTGQRGSSPSVFQKKKQSAKKKPLLQKFPSPPVYYRDFLA
jgi:hypothetical protein